MLLPLCRHIRTNGLQCRAIALTGGVHCYFHNRLYARHSGFHHHPIDALLPSDRIQLAPLEDRDSVQVALSVVINALATGQLETKRAAVLLYGLQMASSNAARLSLSPPADEIVRTVDSTPEGLDLAAPGAVFDEEANLNWHLDLDEEEEEEEEEEEDEEEDPLPLDRPDRPDGPDEPDAPPLPPEWWELPAPRRPASQHVEKASLPNGTTSVLP